MFLIGIAGGSGSGKTTFANDLRQIRRDLAYVSFDNYYKDLSHLSPEKRALVNFDEPGAFDLDLLVSDLKKLKNNEAIEMPDYDFTSHNRTAKTTVVKPEKFILLDGLFTFSVPAVAALCDLKIYMETPADIRLARRVQRDIASRGRRLEDIIRQYETTVKPMHMIYIEPYKNQADIMIPDGGQKTALAVINAYLDSF